MAQEIAANWFVQARLPVPVTKKTAFLSAVQSLPSAGKGGKLCHKNHWVKDTAGAQIFFFGWISQFVGFSEARATRRDLKIKVAKSPWLLF